MQHGKAIRTALLHKSMTQTDLANKLGVTRQSLNKTLARQDLGLDELKRLADAIGYDMRVQLMDRDTGKVIDVD